MYKQEDKTFLHYFVTQCLFIIILITPPLKTQHPSTETFLHQNTKKSLHFNPPHFAQSCSCSCRCCNYITNRCNDNSNCFYTRDTMSSLSMHKTLNCLLLFSSCLPIFKLVKMQLGVAATNVYV